MENVQIVAKETLGFPKKKREQWISDSSWKLMSVRKEMKIQLDSCDLSTTSEYKDYLRKKHKKPKGEQMDVASSRPKLLKPKLLLVKMIIGQFIA